MAEGPGGILRWVTVDSTITLGQTITLQSEKVFTDKVDGNDVAVNIYEDSQLLDTANVSSGSQLYYSYTPNTVGVHRLQYGNTGEGEILYITVTSNSMTNKVEIKTDIVTPLEEWFEQKSKKKTSFGQTPSDDNYPSEKLVKDSLDGKVDKVSGKGLSTEDYTTAEKTKLSGIETGANKTTVDSALSSSSTNPVQNKVINTALSNKADSSSVPTKTSDLTNDGSDGTNAFVSTDDSRLTDARTPTSHAHGQITNDGKITSSAVSVASGDNILITDTSDSNKVKRVANLLADHIQDGTAHSNIGSSANETQSSINTKINTALGNKADSSNLSNYVLTSKILSDIATATDNTQLVGAKELKDEMDALRGEVPTGVELSANKVASWSGTPNDTHYPSEKLVKDSLDAKLDDSQLKTSISSTSSNTDIPSAKAVYDYVASVPKWTTQVASTLNDLPASGSVGVFYLVPNSSSESQNAYDEYFWNGSAYEKFGTKTIDISNLVTLDDVLEYINSNGSLSLPTTGSDAGYLVFTVS